MPVIFDNDRTINSGVRRTPSRTVPGRFSFCNITLSRENWPAAGVRLSILFSYDGTNFVEVRRESIAAGSIDPKTGVIPPASIGFGWGRDPQPLEALIETDSPLQFATHVTIEMT